MLPVTILVVFGISTYCQGYSYSSDNTINSNTQTEPATIEEYQGEEWIVENERRGGADRIQPDNNGGYAQTWWEPQTRYQYNENNMAEENDDPIAHAADLRIVRPKNILPYSAIVYMVLNNKRLGEQICTGVFIAPKAILTAAHCVAEFDVKTKTQTLFTPTIIQRQKGCSNDGVDQYTYARILKPPKYWYWLRDYAVIITKEKSKATLKLPNVPPRANCVQYNIMVIYGYPNKDNDARCLYRSACPLLKKISKGKKIRYECGSKHGMSGGPIIDHTTQEFIGINIAGDDGKTPGNIEPDTGLCITKEVKDQLNKWVSKFGKE